MSNVRKQLIRLGSEQPYLRKHIRPILNKIKRNGPSRKVATNKRKASVYTKWENITRSLGHEKALVELIAYVGGTEARSNFEYIARMYDLPVDVGPRDRAGDLLDKFEPYLDIPTLAQNFVKALPKRLFKEAVEDIEHMYGL